MSQQAHAYALIYALTAQDIKNFYAVVERYSLEPVFAHARKLLCEAPGEVAIPTSDGKFILPPQEHMHERGQTVGAFMNCARDIATRPNPHIWSLHNLNVMRSHFLEAIVFYSCMRRLPAYRDMTVNGLTNAFDEAMAHVGWKHTLNNGQALNTPSMLALAPTLPTPVVHITYTSLHNMTPITSPNLSTTPN